MVEIAYVNWRLGWLRQHFFCLELVGFRFANLLNALLRHALLRRALLVIRRFALGPAKSKVAKSVGELG